MAGSCQDCLRTLTWFLDPRGSVSTTPELNELEGQIIFTRPMVSPLLTALNSEGHVHLIIGSNPIANARCSKSLEAGAKPKVVAPPGAEFYHLLAKKIEEGEIEWIKKSFEEEDLTMLGRPEVDNVVDAVFVTSSGKNAFSTPLQAFTAVTS